MKSSASQQGGQKTSYRLWSRLTIPVSVVGAVANIPKHRKILGETLRASRKEAGLSQERLAELADLHPNYIGEVERGEKNISIDALLRIAHALNVPMAHLVAGL